MTGMDTTQATPKSGYLDTSEEWTLTWEQQRAEQTQRADELEDLGLDAAIMESARVKHLLLDEAAVYLYHRLAQFPSQDSALLNVLLRLVDLGLPRDALMSLVVTIPVALPLTSTEDMTTEDPNWLDDER
jgi:hypothetical protein